MRYKKLFSNLREYALNTPDLNLKHYREICNIIWNVMSPTEQELFDTHFKNATTNLTIQYSLKSNLEAIEKYKKP